MTVHACTIIACMCAGLIVQRVRMSLCCLLQAPAWASTRPRTPSACSQKQKTRPARARDGRARPHSPRAPRTPETAATEPATAEPQSAIHALRGNIYIHKGIARRAYAAAVLRFLEGAATAAVGSFFQYNIVSAASLIELVRTGTLTSMPATSTVSNSSVMLPGSSPADVTIQNGATHGALHTSPFASMGGVELGAQLQVHGMSADADAVDRQALRARQELLHARGSWDEPQLALFVGA